MLHIEVRDAQHDSNWDLLSRCARQDRLLKSGEKQGGEKPRETALLITASMYLKCCHLQEGREQFLLVIEKTTSNNGLKLWVEKSWLDVWKLFLYSKSNSAVE